MLPDTSDCCQIHPLFFIGHLFKFLNKLQTLFPLLEKQRVPLHIRQFEESVRKAFFKSILNNVLIDEVLPESRIQTSPERKQRMLVSIPPKYSVSQFMGYLKGKSSLMIFDRHANLKYKYGNRQFWCKGYYVDTVGRNKKVIAEYIRNQLAEDKISDQISIKEYFDPFTGEQVTKSK